MAHAYAEQPWSGGRLVGLLGAIAVNVLFIAAIATGLNFDVINYEPPRIIDVVPVVDPLPPKPDEMVPTPLVVAPKPDVPYVPPIINDFPPDLADSPEIATPFDPSPQQPSTPLEATQLQADPRYPLAPPIYPPWSIRHNEQGVVTLLIYVTPDGRVGDVRIKRSSGFRKLDEAAVMAARRDWRFQPATQGGAAVAAWGEYAVAFVLRDQE